jgi:hypothetical protein
VSRKRWRRRRAEACRGRRGRFARDRERIWIPGRPPKDYVSPSAEALAELELGLASARVNRPVYLGSFGENSETPGPRLADLEREVARELNGRK